MPFAAIQAYARDLPRHRAQYELMLAEANALPHLKDSERRTVVERLQREAAGGPELDEDAAPLRGIGFGGMSVKTVETTRTWSEMESAEE